MYFLPFIQHCKYLKHAYRFFGGGGGNKYLKVSPEIRFIFLILIRYVSVGLVYKIPIINLVNYLILH